MVAALTAAIGQAVAAGDTEAARVAHEALGKLLASDAATPAGVVELQAERRKRR